MSLIMMTCSSFAGTKKSVITLNGGNVVLFDQDINNASLDTFLAAFVAKRSLLPEDEILYVLIVSGGGNTDAALVIREVIASASNVSVICKYCGSGAAMIFVTAKGERLATKKSVIIMHEMYLPHFTARQVDRKGILDDLVKSSDAFNALIYTSLGMSKEKYEEKIIGKEWTLKGIDLVSIHAATRFVELECTEYVKNMAPDTCSSEEK